jgi:phage virion morphogenesis protein
MIEVTTDTVAFDSSLQQLQKRLGNLKPLMQEMGAIVENKVRDRRETRTDPDGDPWAPWKASTIATYPAGGRGKLLERTGAMWDRSGPGWKATADSVRIGFDKAYATYHEFGTKNMARRGLLFSNPDTGALGAADEQAITDLLDDWLNRQL